MAQAEAGGFVPLSAFEAQGESWRALTTALEKGTLPHAVLLCGQSGVGKRTLAQAITMSLLCERGATPCRQCAACRQVLAGTHPDAPIVQPGFAQGGKSDAGNTIKVEDIRELTRRAGMRAYEGGALVFRIDNAPGRMNIAAQNALLKTLEEPQEGVYILITEESPRLLLSTIVSRCRLIQLHAWPEEQLLRILRAQGVAERQAADIVTASEGSIGRALALAGDSAFQERRAEVLNDFFGLTRRSDIPAIADKWAKEARSRREAADELLGDVDSQLRTLMLVRLGRLDAGQAAHYPAPWPRAAKEIPLARLVRLTDAVAEARRRRESNVTWQAVLEQLLFVMMEEKSQW